MFYEPTDMRRAHLPFTLPRSLLAQIRYASPNVHELHAIAHALDYQKPCDADGGPDLDQQRHLQTVAAAAAFVHRQIGTTLLVTMGSLGVLLATETAVRFYAAPRVGDIVNVSGAGDSFASGFVAALIGGRSEAVCVSVGFAAAAAALRSCGAVPDRYDLGRIAAPTASSDCWTTDAAFDTI